MYNFIKFTDLLEKTNKDASYIKKALDLIKDDFHIGRIESKGEDVYDFYEYIGDPNIEANPTLKYEAYGINYAFFKRNDGYEFSEDELNDIKLLLRLLSVYHSTFILSVKAREAERLSHNTKLLNAHSFSEEVVLKAKKIDVTKYNSYFINLRGFGLINKMYGAEVGDIAIIRYSQILAESVEEDELVGHLGGDNFVAFVRRDRHDEFVKKMSLVSFDLKYKRNIININITSIIGYAEIDNKKVNHGELISKASIACQYARNTKKQIVKLTDELVQTVNSIKKIENTFNDELEKGNFIVYYQPKFNIITGRIIGVEALSRWKHNGEILPPGVFVPILEKNGDIVKLDLHVLENLCKDIDNFRNMGNNIVPASCNLSRRAFELDDIEERVINIIKKYNVRTEDIVIEVTETTNLEEKERLAKFITIMHNNGIMTSIDDFGTGYSSLSVLRDFKVNEIKIDRSFIDRKTLSKSDEIIIGSIINMAKRLDINVICEGVETEEQAQFLVDLGCKRAQGFLYSKPVPKLEFEAMFETIGTFHDDL